MCLEIHQAGFPQRMADFHVWGRIEQIGPAEFVVIVSTVNEADPSDAQTASRLAPSRQEAEGLRDLLVTEAGAVVRTRGGRVTDVEVD